jgi:hypothetical protein
MIKQEIRREKIPASLESLSSSPRFTTSSSSTEVTSLRDMVLEAVRIIHQFSKYPHGVPREVHSRILQTLQEDHKKAVNVPNLNEWSDGSMWMRVLEAGGSENRKVTIFNMLEIWEPGSGTTGRSHCRRPRSVPKRISQWTAEAQQSTC